MGNLDWEHLGKVLLPVRKAAYSGGERGIPSRPSRLAPAHKQAVAERELVGYHPTGIGPANAAAGCCGTCIHRTYLVRNPLSEHPTGSYKCGLLPATHKRGRTTDIKLRWPACGKFVRDPNASDPRVKKTKKPARGKQEAAAPAAVQ